MQSTQRQSGSVLIVVIFLLLLASVLTLLTLNIGVFEQRTSGNDLKSKIVNEVAETGLSQATEFLQQHYSYIKDDSKWTLCTATDTSFPCGSVAASKRATMYRWSGGGYDFDGSGSISGWETKMLPLDTTSTTPMATAGNGFAVQYGVGAVRCLIAVKTTAATATSCTDSSTASTTSIITLVSVAKIPNEGASSTVTTSIGAFNILNNIPGTPPILASGSIDLTGTLQIVTNPNSAGTGVPVSVWTRKDVSKTGTPNSCYYNEFLHNTSGSSNGTIYADTGSPNFPLCDNCSCAGADSLSYDNSGNKQTEGIDILDNETVQTGINSNVLPTEFPCDLFQQIFGVQAWSDNDADNFCETKIMTTYKNPNTGSSVTMGVDEAYLYANATTIIPTATTAALNLLQTSPSQADPYSNYPSSSYKGLVWCQTNCGVGSNKQLGTATNPVLLVSDDCGAIQGKVFGMVFCRSLNAAGNTITPAAGYTMSAAVIAKGGNASFSMNAGSVVYGSVVVQGVVNKANGNAAVVYNGDILQNLLNFNPFNKLGSLAGSWTDRTTY